MIKVSVCIVTYNHEKFIEKAIDSALSQVTDFNFEVIVVEDASTDSTAEIVRRFLGDDRVTIVIRDKNRGVMANYEELFSRAKGKYISFLDGDDYMLPGKLQAQANILDSDSSLAVCSHPLIYIQEDNGTYRAKVPAFYSRPKRYTLENLVEVGFVFSHSSKMFRRESLPDEGVDQSTKNCTDYLLHMQNCLNGDIYHLNTPLGVHRVHKASLSQKNKLGRSLMRAYSDQVYALDIIEKSLGEEGRIEPWKESLRVGRLRLKKWLVKSLIRSFLKV